MKIDTDKCPKCSQPYHGNALVRGCGGIGYDENEVQPEPTPANEGPYKREGVFIRGPIFQSRADGETDLKADSICNWLNRAHAQGVASVQGELKDAIDKRDEMALAFVDCEAELAKEREKLMRLLKLIIYFDGKVTYSNGGYALLTDAEKSAYDSLWADIWRSFPDYPHWEGPETIEEALK